jgi:F-type H+-transporting ATPase subunit a
MGVEQVFPRPVFELFGLPVRDSVLQALLIVLVLSVFAVLTAQRYRAFEPRTWQLVVEWLVEYMEGLIIDTAGRAVPEVVPLLTSMILFIALGNLLGLLPILQAPTRDLNTVIGLAVVSMGSWIVFGVRSRGALGYLRSFIEPVAFMLPLNLLGFFSRLLSMTLRLFGNVIANEIIGAVFFMLMPILAPLPMALLGMVVAVLQALVFTVLTFVFIMDAMASEPEVSA